MKQWQTNDDGQELAIYVTKGVREFGGERIVLACVYVQPGFAGRCDGATLKMRNASDTFSTCNDGGLDGLTYEAHTGEFSDGVTNHGVAYREVCSIDLRRAKRMSKTLTTIARKMDGADDALGRPSDWAESCLRFAAAIGTKTWVFKTDGTSSDYDGNTYSVTNNSGARYRIGEMVDAMTADNPKKENVAG